MKVEQISIFLENKSGRLAEVTGILSRPGVNIRAKTVLKESGFTVAKTEVIALEVPDKPGGLGSILKILDAAGINVEYMYAFVQRSGDNAIIIFRFDELDKAIR